MIDLDDRFARAFQDEPPLPPVADRITAGRRALRHRRAAYAGGTALATAALLVAVPALGADVLTGGTGTVAPPATASSAAPSSPPPSRPTPSSPSPNRSTAPAPLDLSPGEWVAYDGVGRLVLRDGVQVLQRIRDPWPGAEKSVALALRRGDETKWFLLELSRDGSSSSSVPAGQSYATLRQWVESQVGVQAPANPVDWVRFRPGTDILVPSDGVTMVSQVAEPNVPGFAEPGDTTAAAELVVGGERWYVLARRFADGTSDAVATAGAAGGATLEDFLDHARAQYSSGEGLR